MSARAELRRGCAYTGTDVAKDEWPNQGWRQPSAWLREDWLEEEREEALGTVEGEAADP
jgi:hypothetical protein